MNLYEIAEELNKAVAELDGMDLTQEERADSLAVIQAEYDTKMDNFIAWIKCLKAEEAVYKEEAASNLAVDLGRTGAVRRPCGRV
ncbi:MAG: siphovirus Gp157 family protein [Chloroflexi bacterium]|nr:siphovirus Gp157 family protein [Chloroflexota bacterium]